MATWLHEHAWVPAGHVLRCGDPDCIAWVPLPLADPEAVAPAQLPPRRRKPKPDPDTTPTPARSRRAQPKPAAAGGVGSNVVPLARRREVQ